MPKIRLKYFQKQDSSPSPSIQKYQNLKNKIAKIPETCLQLII